MPRGKSQKSQTLIAAAREILAEIQPATVRAVCYRLFVRGLLPSMAKSSTNGVSTQLVWAREHGIIPWAWIVDETRDAERAATWDNPALFRETVQRAYRRDRWTQQPGRVEVWSEKGTIRGTLAPILAAYGVTFRVLHGYASATTAHDVAAETRALSAPLLVLYCGEWDCSGLHMSELDLPRRLDEYGARVELQRVALTAQDVADPALPSFPTESKRRDPRWAWYTAQYGRDCWELDALSPVALRARVDAAIQAVIDWPAWERCGRTEAAEQASLAEVLGRWTAARAG